MKQLTFFFTLLFLVACASKLKVNSVDTINNITTVVDRPFYFELHKTTPNNPKLIDFLSNLMKKNPNVDYILRANSNAIEIDQDPKIGEKRLSVIKKMFLENGINHRRLYMADYKDKLPIDKSNLENNRYVIVEYYKEANSNGNNTLLISKDNIIVCDFGYPRRNILFQIEKISPININLIDTFYLKMKDFPNKRFILEAHSDNIEFKKDSTLGKKRLELIKNIFIKKGIKPENLFTVDYKNKRPIETNETEVGRGKNRRIEIKVKEE